MQRAAPPARQGSPAVDTPHVCWPAVPSGRPWAPTLATLLQQEEGRVRRLLSTVLLWHKAVQVLAGHHTGTQAVSRQHRGGGLVVTIFSRVLVPWELLPQGFQAAVSAPGRAWVHCQLVGPGHPVRPLRIAQGAAADSGTCRPCSSLRVWDVGPVALLGNLPGQAQPPAFALSLCNFGKLLSCTVFPVLTMLLSGSCCGIR